MRIDIEGMLYYISPNQRSTDELTKQYRWEQSEHILLQHPLASVFFRQTKATKSSNKIRQYERIQSSMYEEKTALEKLRGATTA